MAVTLTISCFERFLEPGRSLRLSWRSCQFLDFLHSVGRRWNQGFLINILFSKDYPNSFQTRVLTNLSRGLVFLDPSREIAETPILSLRWFKSLQRLGLRGVSCHARRLDLYSNKETGHFKAQNSCSVWVLQTNTLPIGLNRISWKRSYILQLMICNNPLPIGLNRISWKRERISEISTSDGCAGPTDWVKSD